MKNYKYLIQALEEIGEAIVEEYKSELRIRDKIASGVLFNSVNYRIEQNINGLTLYFNADDYYINVEKGRKPGGKFPPINVIKA